MNQRVPSERTAASLGELNRLALEFVHQNGDAAIRFGTDNVTGAVLTGNQLALKV